MTNEHVLLNNSPSNPITKIEKASSSDFLSSDQYLHYYYNTYFELIEDELSKHLDAKCNYLSSSINLSSNNPTKLTHPFQQCIVINNIPARIIAKVLGLNYYDSKYDNDPLWCLQRRGESRTMLSDKCEVIIGGEYEDFDDPRFYIYNDVVVKHPDNNVDIFCYPKHIFPPTCYHTATLVDNHIWIIGTEADSANRNYSQTQVLKLNLDNYKIELVETVNSMGCIAHHDATYRDGQIIVSGGQYYHDTLPSTEIYDTWSLNLTTLIWKNITKHKWQTFLITRRDEDYNSISQYVSLHNDIIHNDIDPLTLENYSSYKLFKQLFRPPIEHTEAVYEQDYVFVIIIDGINVRFVNEGINLQVYIEGELPKEKVAIIKENLKHKLEKLENAPCEIVDF